MPAPTVSIVMAAYQAEDTVERALRSVLAQTNPDLEVVVVDDGSTDHTRELVSDLAADAGDDRIVLAPPTPNGGPSAARNQGVALARGSWIGFLDADDEYRPDFVRMMLTAVQADDQVDVAVCAHGIVQTDGTRRVRTPYQDTPRLPGPTAALLLLEDNMTPYVWDKLFRRDLLGEAPFPTAIHRAEDTVVALHSLLAARQVRILDVPLHTYYVSATSLTWGRVTPLEESDRLSATIAEAASPLLSQPRGRRAVAVSRTLTYVNAAHQGITGLDRAEADRFTRTCAARVSWSTTWDALRSRPFAGAAAVLLKLSPGLYRRAYSAYIRRAYAIDS